MKQQDQSPQTSSGATGKAAGSVFLADEAATEAFGQRLGLAVRDLPQRSGPAAKIYLSGDLGAGKTTLARGLMRAMGHQGAVKSPTYTLVEPYEQADGSIYHFDLYRMFDPEELEFLGVWDYFEAGRLCLVEWPEKGAGVLPPPDLQIELLGEAQGRRISWRSVSPLGLEIAGRLQE